MNKNPFNYKFDDSEFSVDSHNLKEKVSDNGGRVLAEINLTYPQLKDESSQLAVFSKFNGFYKNLAENFAEFAKSRLKASAAKLSEENFTASSAVMKYIPSFENESIISIVTDVFIFNGGKRSQTKRFSHNWKKSGGGAGFDDFFKRGASRYIPELILKCAESSPGKTMLLPGYEKLIKTKFKRENIFIAKTGIGFFYEAGAVSNALIPSVYILSFDELQEYLSSNLIN